MLLARDRLAYHADADARMPPRPPGGDDGGAAVAVAAAVAAARAGHRGRRGAGGAGGAAQLRCGVRHLRERQLVRFRRRWPGWLRYVRGHAGTHATTASERAQRCERCSGCQFCAILSVLCACPSSASVRLDRVNVLAHCPHDPPSGARCVRDTACAAATGPGLPIFSQSSHTSAFSIMDLLPNRRWPSLPALQFRSHRAARFACCPLAAQHRLRATGMRARAHGRPWCAPLTSALRAAPQLLAARAAAQPCRWAAGSHRPCTLEPVVALASHLRATL